MNEGATVYDLSLLANAGGTSHDLSSVKPEGALTKEVIKINQGPNPACIMSFISSGTVG